ncbi:vWA domain-containing protein [Pajaroellobacter abortibovis]|uniref:VWFA domain-containing protein n=1 Tax=Pajaroellobacter abortibovis TaxID=1882918 RepID=A0A1L6MV00_9BACT|nr:vWA domain-containing protein [Pajaroellobacter abortibovis]APR99287.1 hypothetical protein BCY86_00310 [Pajaroellobacter abortibovis]
MKSCTKRRLLFCFVLIGCSGSHSSNHTRDGGLDPSSQHQRHGEGGLFVIDADSNPSEKEEPCNDFDIEAQVMPLNLMVTFDRSASMNGGDLYSMCRDALKGFFLAFNGSDVQASLIFFPSAGVESRSYSTIGCDVSSYANPTKDYFVPLTKLPTHLFDDALSTIPADGYITPTLPTLLGVFSLIDTWKQQQRDARFVHLLISDGKPTGCGARRYNIGGREYSNDIEGVRAAVERAYKQFDIPTYVIGLGEDLDEIAEVGNKTRKAIYINRNDPAVAAQQFKNTLEQIRRDSIQTIYKIPSPPVGRTYNFQGVTVTYTPPSGSPIEVPYSDDPSVIGWCYDNIKAPRMFVLSDKMKDYLIGGGRVDFKQRCNQNPTIPPR